MRRRKEEYKQNNFNGNVNFTGKTQIAAGDIINNISEEKQKTANYDPEPKWRSPFTLASGYGNRLTIEKIHIEGCPQCGGKMKYYNKPVEWREILRSDGSMKREVTKRIPVLECKRNAEHWYAVDPAEDEVK